MCEQELEHKYRNLAQGRTILESSLHQNLTEHLNSEIGLGTITNVSSAKDWIHKSFLRQRIEQNPHHYHIGKSAEQTWEERLDDMVLTSIKKTQRKRTPGDRRSGRRRKFDCHRIRRYYEQGMTFDDNSCLLTIMS